MCNFIFRIQCDESFVAQTNTNFSTTAAKLKNLCPPHFSPKRFLLQIIHYGSLLTQLLCCLLQIRDMGQEPCGRLSFLKEPKTSKGLPQTAICNLNITLPTHKKVGAPWLNGHPYQAISYHPHVNEVEIQKAVLSLHPEEPLKFIWSEVTACCLCLLLVLKPVPVVRPHNIHMRPHMQIVLSLLPGSLWEQQLCRKKRNVCLLWC